MSEINNKLFYNYHEIHSVYLDGDDELQQKRTNARAEFNYMALLPSNTSISILEIGCNKGYFLHWLRQKGYHNLTGVDLSAGDIEYAHTYVPNIDIYCIDALKFLEKIEHKYDVIIFRAVFEHIEKSQSEKFLQVVGKALKPDGSVYIEVPNMDWLLSNHERYMDFTHEVGFTHESLRQLLYLYYEKVDLYRVKEGYFSFSGMIRVKILKPIIYVIIHIILSILGEGASSIWWQNRHILAVSKSFKHTSQ